MIRLTRAPGPAPAGASGTRARPEPGATRAQRRLLAALFWLPLAAAVVAVAARPPHTVDGPAHLLGAVALLGHGDAGGVYDEYYRLDTFPAPNLAGTLLLAGLVEATSLRVAETLVLIAAAAGLPLALRYAIRGIRPQSAWLAAAGLPLGFGYLYFYGFYNFCLGLAGCLLCAGMTLRAAPRWGAGRALALTGLLTATWFTHLVPFALALVFVAAVVLAGPRTARSVALPALAALPGLALTLAYATHTEQGSGPTWSAPPGRLLGLVSLHTPITTYSGAENVVSAAIAAVLLALGVRAVRTRRAGRPGAAGTALAALAATALLLAAPSSLGIDFGLIDVRLSYFPVLFAVLWLAASAPPPRIAIAAATALVVATGALAAVRAPELRRYDRLVEEYASAAALIEPGSTLLALRFAAFTPDAGRVSGWDPLRHRSSALAAATGSVDVGHYEAVLDYFPTRFRPERDLRRAIDPDLRGLPQVPPQIDLDAAAAANGRPIDYVLLVGGPQAATAAAAAALAAARADLAANYELLGATGPTGLVEVWAARD